MKALLSTLLLASTFSVAPALAVDPTISPLCRGDLGGDYSGFCAQVASNRSLNDQAPAGGALVCPAGQEPNPTPPPFCVPE